jgi:hypothetical protein
VPGVRGVRDLAVPALLGTIAFATTTAPCQQPSPEMVGAVTIVSVVGKNAKQPTVALPRNDVLLYEGPVRKRAFVP